VRVYRVRLAAAENTPESALVEVVPLLPLPDKPSIAVLPFQNMSGDPEQEYFADGMVEEIITALSRIRWLFVIARNSSFTYRGHSVDVEQVGRELGVRYVLEGSVRKAGQRVRITCQLIDALLARTFGPIASTARWMMSSSFRTKLLSALPESLSPATSC
jgi:adenylate cyclase